MKKTSLDIKNFQRLFEVSKILISSLRKEELMEKIVKYATEMTNSLASSFLLFNEKKQYLTFEITTGSKGPELKNLIVKKGEGIAGWVAEKGESVISNNLLSDDRYNTGISEKIEYPTRNILCSPVKIKDEVIGVLEVLNKSEGDYNEMDKIILENFCDLVGISFINAKKYDDLFQKNINLKGISSSNVTFDDIIGNSKEWIKIINTSMKVAKSTSPILILGESGTGKELIASAIHNESNRKNNPFVVVNCGAMVANLVESELFGYVKGAFTGADRNHVGKMAAADKGTIFFDEIGELPMDLQSKLLRAIQFNEFTPVGSTRPKYADVRIIAATNKNLADLVNQRKFREDLYFRLNVIPINLPPLRNRIGDIELLCDYFLKRMVTKHNKFFIKGFTEDVIEEFKKYSWPGNIRELENTIERCVLLAGEDYINSSYMITEIDSKNSKKIKISNNFTDKIDGQDLKTAKKEFEKGYIKKYLEQNDFNITQTAKLLNVQRTYLSRLIKEYELK